MVAESGNDALDGGKGNDWMEGGSDHDNMVGGEGSDTMYGGIGNDTLYGASWENNYSYQDSGNYLYGNDGNDNLYGGNGSDFMDGGANNDGLFGGLGSNTLWGRGGADRFLVRPGESIADLQAEDARLTFSNGLYGDQDWTDREIYLNDVGIAFLHAQTNNTRLLKLRSGGELTIQRVGSLGENVLADNDSMGLIRVADYAFTATVPIHENIIHEIGHNWDDERSSQEWTNWLNLSGWRPHNNGSGSVFPPDGYSMSGDGEWNYLATAQFHRDYGKDGPMEDWSTMWESYYQWKTGTLSAAKINRLQAKLNFVDAFFASQRT